MFTLIASLIGIGLISSLFTKISSFFSGVFGYIGKVLPWLALAILVFLIVRYFVIKRSER